MVGGVEPDVGGGYYGAVSVDLRHLQGVLDVDRARAVAGPGAGDLRQLPMFHCNGWCFPWAVTAVAARHDRRCERPRHLDLT